MGDGNLTKEQKEFLRSCEEKFKDRYTEKDVDFMKVKSAEPKKPPIVDPWYNKPRRPHFDWTRQNQGQHKRNHHWEQRRNSDRFERADGGNRHAGKHHLHQRNYKPY